PGWDRQTTHHGRAQGQRRATPAQPASGRPPEPVACSAWHGTAWLLGRHAVGPAPAGLRRLWATAARSTRRTPVRGPPAAPSSPRPRSAARGPVAEERTTARPGTAG